MKVVHGLMEEESKIMTSYFCRRCGEPFEDDSDFYPSILCNECSKEFSKKMFYTKDGEERGKIIEKYL